MAQLLNIALQQTHTEIQRDCCHQNDMYTQTNAMYLKRNVYFQMPSLSVPFPLLQRSLPPELSESLRRHHGEFET